MRTTRPPAFWRWAYYSRLNRPTPSTSHATPMSTPTLRVLIPSPNLNLNLDMTLPLTTPGVDAPLRNSRVVTFTSVDPPLGSHSRVFRGLITWEDNTSRGSGRRTRKVVTKLVSTVDGIDSLANEAQMYTGPLTGAEVTDCVPQFLGLYSAG